MSAPTVDQHITIAQLQVIAHHITAVRAAKVAHDTAEQRRVNFVCSTSPINRKQLDGEELDLTTLIGGARDVSLMQVVDKLRALEKDVAEKKAALDAALMAAGAALLSASGAR